MKYRKTIITSIILHLLGIVLVDLGMRWNLFSFQQVEATEVDTKPLVFELQDQDRSNEVIETPDEAEIPVPQDADYASDKNARAQNQETDPNVNVEDPFARGDFDVRELPTPQTPRGQPVSPNQPQEEPRQQQEREPEEDSERGDLYAAENNAFREYLTNPNKAQPGASDSPPKVQYDNQDSRSDETGALSFNTYDWDFAPYMLMLKKRVERNIFPPPAFTRMGMIDGETVLRFRIYPDGRMTALDVLNYTGHHTLKETSVRAIEISAPFPELPEDFPKPFLEVTAKFSYFIQKATNQRREAR